MMLDEKAILQGGLQADEKRFKHYTGRIRQPASLIDQILLPNKRLAQHADIPINYSSADNYSYHWNYDRKYSNLEDPPGASQMFKDMLNRYKESIRPSWQFKLVFGEHKTQKKAARAFR